MGCCCGRIDPMGCCCGGVDVMGCRGGSDSESDSSDKGVRSADEGVEVMRFNTLISMLSAVTFKFMPEIAAASAAKLRPNGESLGAFGKDIVSSTSLPLLSNRLAPLFRRSPEIKKAVVFKNNMCSLYMGHLIVVCVWLF